jgi:hypothetical protein
MESANIQPDGATPPVPAAVKAAPAPAAPPPIPPVMLTPIERQPANEYIPPILAGEDTPNEEKQFRSQRALQQFENSLPASNGELAALRPFFIGIAQGATVPMSLGVGQPIMFDGAVARQALAKAADPANSFARIWRESPRYYQTNAPGASGPGSSKGRLLEIDEITLAKSDPLVKSVLDVATTTFSTTVTGGQSLGYFSLDTRVARGTVRPDSFTLYQSLAKSAANQVVDYFAYIDDPGGALPGSATSGFSNVSSGTLATNAGIYTLQAVNLKLMLDGRAVTMALMAQNNFVSVNEQENANAALTVLQTADYLCFKGNPNIFPNQFAGIATTIPSGNIFDFQTFVTQNSAQGWSTSQAIYNMIYQVAANIASWTKFGRITHAFMTPTLVGSLQSLVTTLLNNLMQFADRPGIIVDGDLQGMRTRLGPIQFPIDILISSRDVPAQGQPRANGTTPTTTTAPTPPSGVIVTASSTAFVGSNWGAAASAFTGAPTRYFYAVASTDVNMNESNLTWSNTIAGSGITASGAAVVAIGGPAAADAYAYRVFRTGPSGFAGATGVATSVRYIGAILANGSSTVNFTDYNYTIPGQQEIYLLDMREEDGAIDFRYLLPLTRVNLFAANLYMPWAVAMIGAIRNRIPKFHGLIRNVLVDDPSWNPFGAN